jgi:hypothetical protein
MSVARIFRKFSRREDSSELQREVGFAVVAFEERAIAPMTDSLQRRKSKAKLRDHRSSVMAGQTKCSGNAFLHADGKDCKTPFDQTILICPPDYFKVAYVINPWTEQNFPNTYDSLAHRQWNGLRNPPKTAKVV